MQARPDPHEVPRPPPGFTARPDAAPWEAALASAASGAAPGLLFYAPFTGRLDAALILAPDCSIDDDTAIRLATLAMRDCLAALVPPETAVTLPAPGVVAINQGEVARAEKLARGPTGADGIADWLVLGFCVRLDLRLEAPGLTPWLTDLAEEGVDISGATLLDSLCRHLLSNIDVWQAEGAPGIARAWRDAAMRAA